jgi:hypothetical protein
MFLNYWKLLLRRGVRPRLRYEMAYNIFTVVFEPLRVWSFVVLILGGRWLELALIYVLYLLLEIYPYRVIREKLPIGKGALVVLSFPIYNVVNMLLRQVALGVWFWKRFVTGGMRRKTEKDRKWWISPAG